MTRRCPPDCGHCESLAEDLHDLGPAAYAENTDWLADRAESQESRWMS